MFSNTFMSDNLLDWGFLLVFLDFFEVQRCFVDCRDKFYSSAVFFVERWSFSLQDPIFWYFRIFRGLFELDMLL